MDRLVGLSASDDNSGFEPEPSCGGGETAEFSLHVVVRQLVADRHDRKRAVLVLDDKVAFAVLVVEMVGDVLCIPAQVPEENVLTEDVP